jgi:protein-disulfide isomerase
MNRRTLVLSILGLAVVAFAVAGSIYRDREVATENRIAKEQSDTLVRPHSPIIGPANAPVTIVEFLDPSCETCRAFYPFVKKILADHPRDVRLVVRYAPFHEGSDEAVRILEAARLQGKFETVLEAMFATQPTWAIHGAPNLEIAWNAAATAGLDVPRARRDAMKPEIGEVLRQDIQDLNAVRLNRTPTFFVNTKPLTDFGPEQLAALVRSEVEKSGAQLVND